MRSLRVYIMIAMLFISSEFVFANTLIIGIYQDVAWMNPVKTTSAANLRTITQIVESLARLDPETGEARPHLAASWERLDDLTLQLRVREGIVFTNGEPVNAEAVKFSLELLSQEPIQSVALGAVSHVDIVDDYTVNIVTHEPFPLLTLSLALNGHVVPPVYYQEVGEDGFNRVPIGTGPFMFEERISGQRITLVRNDNYWNGPAAFERLEFRPIPEDTARLAALLAGEIHIATNLPTSYYSRLEQATNVRPATIIGFSSKLALLDALPGSPLENPLVRQAINYAVDKETILEVLYEGRGRLSECQLAGPQFFGYNPNLSAYPYDPERAKQLLREAGFAEGLTIDLRYRTSAGDAELSEAIAAMLEDVGIRSNHIILEGGEFLRQLRQFELRNMATLGITTAPDVTYAHNIFLSDAPYSYYRNPEFDRVVREASVAIDPEERAGLLREASRIACEDPVALFLFALEDLYGVSERVRGWEPSPDNLFYFDGVTFE